MPRKKNGRRAAAARAFALALRELRQKQGLAQEDLDPVHRTYISGLERGLHDPSLSTMYTVAPRLGVTYPELSKVVDRHYKKPPKEA